MVRRRLVVLVSALLMIVIGVGVVGALVTATQSEGGRDWIRVQLSRQLARGMHGRLHLGRLSGSFLTDLTIDSLQITDPDDSVFVRSGRIRLTYDPRDVLDGRIIVRSVNVEHPFVVMRRENDDRWNMHKVFPPQPQTPAERPRRGTFGALVVFNNVHIRDAHFQLTLPWAPDDTLAGARRDSAIVKNLALPAHEIRRVTVKGTAGFQRSWHWTDWNLTLNRARFREPDSTGRVFEIARMDIVEHLPPFAFRNMRGDVRWVGDTIWANFTGFELPHSTGRGRGRLDWADGRPIRYDFNIHSDSTGLEDLHWIHSTLPATGVGAMDLRIVSEANPHVVDYVITNMDMRTASSRLRGAMTYGVGAPVLIVKDVDLQLTPLDFRFLETLNGGPFPQPWRGTFTGTLKGRGGPVNHFQVDDARLAFADANVPGAITRAVLRGEVDILSVSRAKFHGMQVELGQFDLRTAQFLNPDFPKLAGVIAGRGTLDSLWNDVRVRDADVTHSDSDTATVSRLKGTARLSFGGARMAFELEAAALPLNVSAFARSYPAVPLRGTMNGPLRLNGTTADLALSADLVGTFGRLQFDGQFDAESPGRAAVIRGALGDFDFQEALGNPSVPRTDFNGRFTVRLEGDSLANLFGSAQLFADRSLVDSVRIYAGRAALRFEGGVARVDSLRVESAAGLLTARGAFGLTSTQRGDLQFAAVVDSLGGLRRYLAAGSFARAADTAVPLSDSLAGSVRVTGTIRGGLARFGVLAAVEGATLRLGSTSTRALNASVRAVGFPDSATGTLSLVLDTLRAGGLSFARVTANAGLTVDQRTTWALAAVTPDSVRAQVQAVVRRTGDTTDIVVDTLTVRTSGNAWALQRTAAFRFSEGGFVVDTLALAGANGGFIALRGSARADSAVLFDVRVDSVPLADLGELLQADAPFGGVVTLRGDVRGTRSRPDLRFTGTMTKATLGSLRLESVTAEGRYSDRRLTTSLQVARAGAVALRAEASLPVDLSLSATGARLLEEPLSARVRADSGGLVLLESFSRSIADATGTIVADIAVRGTWKHPRAQGVLRIHDGGLRFTSLGDVTFKDVEADIAFLGDSIALRGLSARSNPSRTGSARLGGWIGLLDVENPTFDLNLSTTTFTVLARPDVAELDLSGELRLQGARRASTLSGGLTVDHGVIPVPELAQKQVISLDDPEFLHVVDTSAFDNRRLFPAPPSDYLNGLTMRNVQVQMGRDVWLRSEEANINLGGRVNITRSRGERGVPADFALDGSLQTVRGTYRLNLGPVQRPFDVESGELRWFGDPDFRSATMSINALHTVRQFSSVVARPDVRVRVHLGGTLRAPQAELSSPDSLRVTNGDLVSYLVTGGPSNEIGARGGDYTSTAARVLSSSLFSQLGAKATGSICDDAQLSAAGLDAYQGGIRSVGSNILSGTRFNCAKQLSDKAFVRLDAGLCQVGQLVGGTAGSSDPLTFADAIGLKFDYRLSPSVTLSAGMDPPTKAVLCTPEANARGFAPTPRQYGFDLFRIWRF